MLRRQLIPILFPAVAPPWILRGGSVVATLDVDFVNDRAWNGGPAQPSIAALLACSRASSGYYTKADGTLQNFSSNTLRYGTNGLLVEEARTNLWRRSQEFGTLWGQNGVSVTDNTAVAPDGTTTADTITATAAGQRRLEIDQPAAGTTYAHSAYAKFLTATHVGFGWFDGSADNGISWNVQTGTFGQVDGTAFSSPAIEALGNGWYRISAVLTSVGGGGSDLKILVADNANVHNNTTAGVATYLWGAQREVGAFPTSYIPTTSGSATRSADIITFSDLTWLGGTSDSIYAEWIAKNVNNAKVWAFDATNDKLLDEQTGMSARIAGATVGNTAAAGSTVKAAARMVVNDYAISMNGGTVATDTSETAPGTLTASRLGCDLAGANHLNSYIRRIAAFKGLALGNAGLQTLAT